MKKEKNENTKNETLQEKGLSLSPPPLPSLPVPHLPFNVFRSDGTHPVIFFIFANFMHDYVFNGFWFLVLMGFVNVGSAGGGQPSGEPEQQLETHIFKMDRTQINVGDSVTQIKGSFGGKVVNVDRELSEILIEWDDVGAPTR